MVYKCKYFKLQELVSPAVYNRFGDFAWNFLNDDMKKDLDIIREEIWQDGIIINDWFWGGLYKESGLRCNTDTIVAAKKTPYLSGHILGRGFDLKPINSKDAPKLYEAIRLKYHKLKSISRMENIKLTPTWVHVDNLGDRLNAIQIFS